MSSEEAGGRGGPGADVARADQALAGGDFDRAVVHLSAAVRAHVAAGDDRAAAMVCVRLGDLFQNWMGNKVAARPWLNRAMRLVEHLEPCVEQGWAAVASLGCDVDDPAVLAQRAELALDRARRFGDSDLEVKALADGGLARVQAGLLEEGMAMLDEAMALACTGAATDLDTLGKSVCSFYTACSYAGDFGRAESWTPLLRQQEILSHRPGPSLWVSSHCDSVQATLLSHLGRWTEAEDLLLRAHTTMEKWMPGASWHPPIALAELRILQGRLAEAEALLMGREGSIQALIPTARLYLARGDHDLARAAARRGLRLMPSDRVRAATLLGVVVEAELARGDIEAAAQAADDLDSRIAGLGVAALDAEAARLRARVRTALGDPDGAVAALSRALERLGDGQLPRLRLALHLELARVLEAAGDGPGAVMEARAAVALLDRLDVVLTAEDARLLDRLGSRPTAALSAPGCRVATLEVDGDWWTVACDDVRVRLRDTKGLRYLAELVGHPGNERHVLDIVDAVEGVAPAGGPSRRRLGDAGPLLDAEARAAYRRRVSELRDEVEDALAVEDDDRAAAVQAELDRLVAELARAFGLGGKDRRAASAAERARLNVTRAVRTAIAKLAEALPEAGAVLDRSVRTGLFCSYTPAADEPIVWTVRPATDAGRTDGVLSGAAGPGGPELRSARR